MSRVRELVVVFDAGCPRCSTIARELPECVTVRVRARSCAEPRLGEIYPNLPRAVGECATPAIGVVGTDGQVRWWTGLRAVVGIAPVLRPGAFPRSARLLRSALSARR